MLPAVPILDRPGYIPQRKRKINIKGEKMKNLISVCTFYVLVFTAAVCCSQPTVTEDWTVTLSTFDIQGNNLAEAYANLQKMFKEKGEVGSCDCQINPSNSADIMKYDKATNEVVRIDFKPKCIITLPAWPKYTYLSSQCRDVYEKLIEALKKHEDGHMEIFKKHFEEAVAYFKKTAVKKDEYEQKLEEVDKKLNSEDDSYDNSSDHGRRDVNLEAPPECLK
jgi:predicted secreted Zn-dependent protease